MVIFDQWPKLNLGFDVEPEIRKEWPGKMIYLNFDSIFGDFFLKFFEEEVSDYLS